MLELDPLNRCTDEELLARLRKGQRDVFGFLVRRYQGELFGYLARYLGDVELAEDVFQTTFIQIFLKAKQYEPGRPVRPWLYRIATNQAIDALRKVGRHHESSLDEVQGSGDQAISLCDLIESREEEPAEIVDREELRRSVRHALDRLPETLRQVVLLSYFQGLKYQEIADILGIPLGTVKSRLNAALVRFHQLWTEAPSLPEI